MEGYIAVTILATVALVASFLIKVDQKSLHKS